MCIFFNYFQLRPHEGHHFKTAFQISLSHSIIEWTRTYKIKIPIWIFTKWAHNCQNWILCNTRKVVSRCVSGLNNTKVLVHSVSLLKNIEMNCPWTAVLKWWPSIANNYKILYLFTSSFQVLCKGTHYSSRKLKVRYVSQDCEWS